MPTAEIKETIGCKKKLTVEVEKERLDNQIKVTLKRMKSEVQIPGFRKGKAPESLVFQRFGNVVREEAVKDMIPEVINEIFEEKGIKPVGVPEISDFKFDEAGPITFTVTVEETPEIDSSRFEGLRVTKEVREVTDDDVDEYVERLRQMRAERSEVNREAAEDDILVVNLQKMDSSGVPIIGEKMEGHVISLDGKGTPSPEFDKQVIGMKKGDTKRVRFTYDESIGNPDLVGKAEAYDVEVLQVIENKLPELNEEFARSLGDYADINDLYKKARDGISREYETAAERKLEYDLIDEFVKQYPFDVPSSMVEKVIQSEFDSTKKRYPDRQIDEETYRKQIRPDAVRAVQTFLITDTIKKEQEIEATQDEISKRLDEIAVAIGKPVSEVKRTMIKEGRYDSLKNEIIQTKVYDWIKAIANITVETVQSRPEESNIITY